MYGGEVGDMLVTAEAELREDLMDAVSRVAVPVLVVGGLRDRFYSPELFDRTAAGAPNGELLLLEGMGHLRATSSQAFHRATIAFLDRPRAVHDHPRAGAGSPAPHVLPPDRAATPPAAPSG
jgi:pimeloyl-ACP methyl ester carboxylesterase